MEIKICGITSIEEIKYVNKLKPEYIGLVFTESKREISKEKAQTLTKLLDKEIRVVGVFRNNSLSEIKNIIEEVKLDIIQIHGDEDENFIEKLRKSIGEEIKIWKGISIESEEDLNKNIYLKVDNFILDSGNPGSGESFNWDIIKKNNMELKFFLAGGVNLSNIDEIIKNIKPYGIDVSSGVESLDELGNRRKDFYKMKNLIEKVRK